MIYPEADKLDSWGSKYGLVVLAARRAKQIKSGAAPFIHTTSTNPITIALEEIAAGKVDAQVPDNDLPIRSTEEPEVSQLLPLALGIEDEAEALLGDEEEILAITGLDEDEEEEEPVAVFEDEEEAPIIDVDDEDEVAELDLDDEDDEDEEAEEESQNVLPDLDEPKPSKRGRRKSAPAPVEDEPLSDEVIDLSDDDEEEEDEDF